MAIGAIGIALLAPFYSSGHAASQAVSAADGSREAVRRAIDLGSYDEAERQARDWCTRIEAEYGSQSLELSRALDLLVEAQTKNGMTAGTSTAVLAERVLLLKEQHLATSDVDVAASVHNLGVVRQHRGEFAAALALHERGYGIRLHSLGPRDPAVADSLDHLALALIQLDRFKEAKLKLDESIAIRESTSAQLPLALARTLELVGLSRRASGSYADAVPPLERALAIRGQFTPGHPDTSGLLQIRGDVRFLMGEIRGAQETWSDALRLAERTLRADHPALAELLRKLGLAAFTLGNLGDATKLREKALRVAELSLAPCDPSFAAVLGDVANSRQVQGEYVDARRLYRRALATMEKCVTSSSPSSSADAHATNIFNQAALAREIGDLAEADRLYARAVEIWSIGLGADHPFVATGLDALAEVASAQRQFERARRLCERALAMRRRDLGASHPDVAWTLANLARIVLDLDNFPLAQRYVAQAVDIYRRAGVATDPLHLTRVLTLQGELESRGGRYVSARAIFADALSERERVFGRSHPFAAESRAALASVDFALGSHAAALADALEAEHDGRDHLQFTVRYLPERQALAYAAKRPRALDLALSIAASGTTPSSALILDALVKSRGVVLDELVARARAIGGLDPTVDDVHQAAFEARQRFANLVVRSLQESVPRALLDDARQQKEDTERALAENNAEASAEMRRAQIDLKGVDAGLPRNSALLSFVVYDLTKALPKGHRPTSLRPVRSYAAFVHRAGTSDVTFVPLGSAAWVDGLIKAWRREASGVSIAGGSSAQEAMAAYRIAGSALRRAVWDPLRAHLDRAERVFVVPDGLLNIVSLAALPDRDGRYLIDGPSTIHYLSTERDLVALPDPASRRGILAVGGPAFGGRQARAASTTVRRSSGCDGFGNIEFTDLPGSRREVMEISKFWPTQSPGEATVLSGAAATETAVKQHFGGHRIVHLATHGFFLGGDCTPGAAGTRSVGGLAKRASATRDSAVVENPLLLSGLAFAGANRRGSIRGDQDDGILTAEEIGGLNLQGTEWAVLSACDTGLGEIKAGEGVFGLRRAFQVAGARTVIMSLWSVEDRSAMQWMRALYEGRLRKGLDTADAVREASLTVLRNRRARGLSTHPFYWAGFVAAGDWR